MTELAETDCAAGFLHKGTLRRYGRSMPLICVSLCLAKAGQYGRYPVFQRTLQSGFSGSSGPLRSVHDRIRRNHRTWLPIIFFIGKNVLGLHDNRFTYRQSSAGHLFHLFVFDFRGYSIHSWSSLLISFSFQMLYRFLSGNSFRYI